MTRRISWLVMLVDAIMLLLFAYGGEASHELYFRDSLALSVLHAAFPFALVWFPAACFFGVLRDPRVSRPLDFLARTAGAWLIAAPLGIVVRGWLINRTVIPASFLLVTYAIGLALFVGWRVLFILLLKVNRRSKEVRAKGA